MSNLEFNARDYFDKIYQRPVILEAKQLTQSFKHGKTERTILNAKRDSSLFYNAAV